MSSPVVPDLGTNTNARKYIPEVNTGTKLAPIWTPIGGVKNFLPTTDTPQNQDDRRFSDKGFGRMNKTGTDWSATMTFSRAPQLTNTTAYDPGQEALRAAGEGVVGSGAEVQIRWYEYSSDATLPRVQAYMGTALVSYAEPNGGPLDNSDGTVTFTGQGAYTKIAHPYPVAAAAPVLTAAVPGTTGTIAAAGGVLVHIYGSHFSTVTSTASNVTFGGTNATNFSVESDSLIIATAPAHAAGAVNLVVTNPTGVSNNLSVTYA